jgi:hypothetical protein
MKNTFFLLILLSFTNAVLAQVSTVVSWTEKTKLETKNTIYYNAARKLTWNDFKGVSNQPEPIAAITSSGFGYMCNMHTVDGKGAINVNIYCYFNKPNSWVRKGKNTAYILNHEQHHFDVTYIAAKMFIDKVKAAGLTTSNMDVMLSKIYKECCGVMNKMQNDYDAETKNGLLKNKQEEWNKFIDAQLISFL